MFDINITGNLAEEIRNVIDEFEKQQKELQEATNKNEIDILELKTRNDALILKLLQINESQIQLNYQFDELNSGLTEIVNNYPEFGNDPTLSSKQLTEEDITGHESKINILEVEVKELDNEMDFLEGQLKLIENEITDRNDSILKLRNDISNLQELINDLDLKALNKFKINNLTEQALIEERDKINKKIILLNDLVKQSLLLERTIVASQRDALLVELENQKKELLKEKDIYDKESKKLSDIRKWIARIDTALKWQNANAVENHVKSFGPLTSIIQKRLRSVYGFGNIELRAKEKTIEVEVSWQNKTVKPVDYFSDSQKQILMLSIFLSGRLTQTWSGFAPILLDDPVTHFDDLNGFAFIELVRGLVGTSPGRRQFFISTCEDKLFELMKKKFNKIEGGAIFYKFESIGQEGPVINRVDK